MFSKFFSTIGKLLIACGLFSTTPGFAAGSDDPFHFYNWPHTGVRFKECESPVKDLKYELMCGVDPKIEPNNSNRLENYSVCVLVERKLNDYGHQQSLHLAWTERSQAEAKFVLSKTLSQDNSASEVLKYVNEISLTRPTQDPPNVDAFTATVTSKKDGMSSTSFNCLGAEHYLFPYD